MKKRFLLVLVLIGQLLCGIAAHAQTVTIFDYASTWRYLDNGTDQGTAWRASAFNDAAWTQAAGVFGYQDSWITQCVRGCASQPCGAGCPTKYITTYFRKTINITDVNAYSGIRLNAWRDDGIVVYVNGVEVWRDNMPTGTITYTTNSATTVDGANENTPFTATIPMSAFVNGNNVIAVEVHQRDQNSSDLTFNMQALGVLTTTAFPYGSSWKFLDNGSNQGTAWSASAYNDAAWATGTGYFGYTDSWINTFVNAGCGTLGAPGSCGPKYITTYFRKTLNIANVSLYDSIRLRMYRDDGAVVYVNGVEVWRENMPTGTINFNILANSPAIGGAAETTAVVRSIPISAFANGNNVIAVEIHQQDPTSSDMTFNMQAEYVLHVVPALVRGPYLQMGTQTATSVRWRTNVAVSSKLEVGTVLGTYPIVVNSPTTVTNHELRVTGLTPDTKYYYRIGSPTDLIQGDSTNFFITAPSDTSTRRVTLAAFGDCGRNDNGFQTSTLTAYRNYLNTIGLPNADALLLLGDNAYNSGTDAEFQNGFYNAYSSTILKNHFLFPAPGNHDYYFSGTAQNDKNMPYYDMFTLPSAGQCGGLASGTEAYYSYNVGDVHVLSLDSYGTENAGTTRMYDTLGAQVNWIKADLAANTKKWTVAYWHHPPFTKGSHNSDTEGELINIRTNFIRILERYGVDVIMCGHSHDYERSYLLKDYYGTEASFNVAAHTASNSSAKYDGTTNSCPYITKSGKYNHGTVYVVAGSSGADGGVQAGYPHDALPFSIDDGGMFFLDIKDNRLDAKFIRRNSTVGDQFTIMKDVQVRDTVEILHGNSIDLSASWNGNYNWAPGATTRTVTFTPANDTVIEVKDNTTGTCLTDRFFVDLQCTTPDITSSPSDITRIGCEATVTYAITDTGRPAPAISYAFAGATTSSGNGTGSGTTFSVGVTTVTVTAANECGSAIRNFTVTIQPLPTVYNVTGGGGYCPGGAGMAVGLDNSQAGVSYQLYDGVTPVGTSVAGTGAAITFGMITAQGTYSVLATDNVTACTQAMASTANVFVHPLPVAYTVTGGGNYCSGGAGSIVGLSGSQSGVAYQLYEGSTAVGAVVNGTGAAIDFGSKTTVGTYSVHATDVTTTCVNGMTSTVNVGINPLPTVHTVTGGGEYCIGGTGVAIGLDNGNAGINYQLMAGTVSVGSPVSGTDGVLTFGAITGAGTYSVLAQNATTGCVQTMTGSANVVINPLPVVYNVTGGGNYCAGGAGVVVNIDNSQAGVNYQLYVGTTATGAPVAGTGAAVSFGSYTTAGTYGVTAINATTGCVNNMAGSANIGIYTLPTIYSVTGGGSYCAGGVGVTIGLGGSSTTVNYQLYNGATAIGTAISGTGSPLDFGLKTMAGIYTVMATDAATSCVSNMAASAAVVVTPLVTPSISMATATTAEICAGTTVTYTTAVVNGGTAPMYEWYVNGTSAGVTASAYSYTPADADSVAVVLTSDVACVTTATATTSMIIDVLPNVLPYASITASPNDTLCEGTPVILSVTTENGGTMPTLTWWRNSAIAATGTTYSFTPADDDAVVLSLTSNAPCRTADVVYSNVIAMQVDESYLPIVNIGAVPGLNIAAGQPVTFTAFVGAAGSTPTYKWAVNNVVVAGATNATFTTSNLNNKDSVSCMVKGSGVCGREGFNTVIMNVVANGVIDAAAYNNLSVVPNPTSGEIRLNGAAGYTVGEQINITITNVLGQTVYTNKVVVKNGSINERIVLGNNLADGTYMLRVNGTSGSKVFHIVLKR